MGSFSWGIDVAVARAGRRRSRAAPRRGHFGWIGGAVLITATLGCSPEDPMVAGDGGYDEFWLETCGKPRPPRGPVAPRMCGGDVSIYVDCDGDGYGDVEFPRGFDTIGCAEPLPPGYTGVDAASDCDDADPTRQRLLHEDKDGDGYGVNPGCVAAGSGIVPFSDREDCDDTDPDRHPGQTERCFDGVDSNCDGNDDADLSIPSLDPTCSCEPFRPTEPPPVDVVCSGAADLVFADIVTCDIDCRDTIFVRVGNRGDLAADPPIEVRTTTRDGAEHVEHVTAPLAPGARSPWITLPHFAESPFEEGPDLRRVQIAWPGSECDATNNSTEVQVRLLCVE